MGKQIIPLLYTGPGGGGGGIFIFKGEIAVAADFPNPTAVENGWTYRVIQTVTDNDPTRTNTGQTFTVPPDVIIAWDGSLWVDITGVEVWLDDGTKVFTINGPRNIDVQNKEINEVELIDLNTSFSSGMQEGRTAWDPEAGTAQIGMAGGVVVLQVGQEMHLPNRPKNDEATQINNGEIVYVSGATGAIPQVKRASAADYPNGCHTIAFATEDVGSNNRGFYTSFGIVRDIDTSLYAEGTELWLSTTPGGYTDTMPDAPNCIVRVGYVIRQHATEGEIFVSIDVERDLVVRAITKEPTGFTEPENVIVTYDETARTITLTGTVNAYWRGEPISVLASGWVSPAHSSTPGEYFLQYDGSAFSWVTPTGLSFHDLFIAFAYYTASDKFALREVHGVMQWQSHEEDHDVIGTYRTAGGTLDDFVEGSTIAADRRPSVSSTTLKDEDLKTINPSLAANGPYTQFFLSGTEDVNFDKTALDIIPLSGNQPYWNELTGGLWQQTLMSNNHYTSDWLVGVPVTSDSGSQEYRYWWIQGQNESSTIAAQRNLSPLNIDMGALRTVIPEFIFFKQVIIQYTAANFSIAEVRDVSGTRVTQTTSPQGNFLTVVATDTTLTGDGTGANPLSVNVSEVVPEAITKEFEATAGQTLFDIEVEPVSKASISFSKNGAVQLSDNYSFLGTVVTWGGTSFFEGERVIIKCNSYSGGSGELWKTDGGAITQKALNTPVRLDAATTVDDSLLTLNRIAGSANGQINVHSKINGVDAQTLGAKVGIYHEVTPNAGDTASVVYAPNWYKDPTVNGSAEKICNITEGNWHYFFSGESGDFRFIDYSVLFHAVRATDGDGNHITFKAGDGQHATDPQSGGTLHLAGGDGVNGGNPGIVQIDDGYVARYENSPNLGFDLDIVTLSFARFRALNQGINLSLAGTIPDVTGDDTVYPVLWDTVLKEKGNNYNGTTGEYSINRTGFYTISFILRLSSVTDINHIDLDLMIEIVGSSFKTINRFNPQAILRAGGVIAVNASDTISLTLNDKIRCAIRIGNGTKTVDIGPGSSMGVVFHGEPN